MSRKSTNRANPADENAPPSSQHSLPIPSSQSARKTVLGTKTKSVNNMGFPARRSSPRLSAAREAASVLGEKGMGVRVEIQAPTSEGSSGSAVKEVRESRIPVRRRASIVPTSSQSLSLPSSQPTHTPRSRSNSTKPRPSASPAILSRPTSTKKTPTRASRRLSGKLLATPNQTFEEAPSTPDSEGDDPLLLKGSQEMRGWGEGKPRREGSWGGMSARSERRGSTAGRRSTSAQKEVRRRHSRSESTVRGQEDHSIGGEVWNDDALAPLGSGGLLSDHEQAQEAYPNSYWKDEDHFFDWPDQGAASASSEADQPDEEIAADVDNTVEIDSPLVRPTRSFRDYSVPVLFTSPNSASRKRPRRPSSPAPSKRVSSSPSEHDPTPANESHDLPAPSSARLPSPFLTRPYSSPVATADEQEETSIMVGSEDLVEPKAEDSTDGKDAFDSSSSTGSEQQLAEDERWKGPPMSEDSPGELSEMEEDEEEDSRAVSNELLSGSREPTPRESPQESNVVEESPVRSLENAQLDTQMIFSPFPVRRSLSTGMEATRIVHFRESAPLDSLILSAPPPPPTPALLPTPPVSKSPAEHTQRRESTVLPTPQVSRQHLHPQIGESSSRRASRPRPSHPTLPVIEISSTDPRAAAVAVAYLKIRHGYVERGLEFPRVLIVGEGNELGGADGRMTQRRGSSWPRKTEKEVERELQNLLVEAERSVSARLSIGQEDRRSSTPNGIPPTRDSSVLANFGSSSRIPSPTLVTTTKRRAWTAVDWRKLEQALIDERRVAKRERRELVAKDVIDKFLAGQELSEEDRDGEWSWSKMETRLSALRQRRARDSESRSRASSIAGTPNPPVLASEIGRTKLSRFNFGAVLRDVVDFRRGGSVTKKLIPAETAVEEEEEEEEASSEGEPNEEEDTFFERARPSRIPSPDRQPSAPPIALASSRHAHLYDDPVEKPPLPVESWQGGYRVKTEELDDDQMLETLRENEEDVDVGIGENPSSSARKLFSYLGSFVRRSAAPELSSPAARRYDDSLSSSSPEPERMDDTISLALLRSQLRPVLPTPQKRHPLSNTSTNRLSFPPAQARRRSSGENSLVQDSINAIESAESSREEGVLPFNLLASASGSLGSGFLRKRVASESDLRGMSARKGMSMDSPSMIPSGTRALERQYELSRTQGKA